MKKILLFITMALAMTACVGPRGPQGPVGPQGPQGEGITRKIVDVQVRSNQWEYTYETDNNLYYAQVSLSEITRDVYDVSNVNVYMIYTDAHGKEIQTMLPSVRHYEYYDANQGAYFGYTQTTDFDYWVGGMEFHITNSDFYYNPDNLNEPGDRTFRIVITY